MLQMTQYFTISRSYGIERWCIFHVTCNCFIMTCFEEPLLRREDAAAFKAGCGLYVRGTDLVAWLIVTDSTGLIQKMFMQSDSECVR